MPTATQLVAFLAASVIFIALPGPSVLFAIGRALTVGRRDALLSVTGNALGLLVQVACVAIGLGALVEASATAYTVLKLVGAGYVIYLGIQAIRHRADARLAMAAPDKARPAGPWRAVSAGFTVGVTNPKTIVFFAAFLPQFMNDAAPATPQLLFLGLLFGALALGQDSIVTLIASQARTWFSRNPKRLDHLSVTGGVAMVGLGAGLALEGSAKA
ncbi:threonine/homoserine/homoserine lactone efflux protein [Promicromonospora sp. AC04]|uniref:LysE family translocator n=1 Tax=Promicromonospora sp. AC04 TaxID=2135723 RepID=UPI000D34D853|nr:LysE family translocator [Promicromonospora sp. AC04]PUB19870.1 threonine/homoserine/homoserine lactone efflux protein [Promicromonospora sp. AC04]